MCPRKNTTGFVSTGLFLFSRGDTNEKCSLSIPTVPPYRHECDRDHAQPARWVEIRPQRLDHTSPGASGSRRSRSAGRRAGGGVSAESAVRDCVILYKDCERVS